MTSSPRESMIREFWSWFTSVAPSFETEEGALALVDSLEDQVSRLGEIGWEVGPGLEAEHSLILSPDGDVDWLPTTQKIIKMAPPMDGWEFHSAKPAKAWELQFSFEGDLGSEIEVDARGWRYVLLQFPDGTFDIIVEQSDLRGLSEDERYVAATIVLDGELGEALRLSVIQGLEVVEHLDEDMSAKASNITNLREHVRALRGATH